MKNCIYSIVFLILVGCSSASNLIENDSYFSKENYVAKHNGEVVPFGYKYSKKKSFKVLSWNVEHFVDSFDDPYINSKRENKPDSLMGNKVDDLIAALKKIDADVVVLQEFESAKFLRNIADNGLSDMGYKYFADVPSHGWYMNVVVMSKFPLGVIYGYGNVTTPILEYRNDKGEPETQNTLNTRMWSVEVYPNSDYNFLLTGVHLKAGRGERNIAMRKGQINFLKQQYKRFLKEDKNKNILVVGDFNSVQGSEEINLFLNEESKREKFIDPLPKTVMTHPSNAPERRLDYMLINTNMYKVYKENSAKVPQLFTPKKMKEISDHLPVITTFIIK
ncbi:endonuclease/exonuclease/phosphatase family protein [Polaribacter sp. PL03]|uniref:endonuclease/exonuclease/phosphatase family protein n=1 Tax=Polaribacter sp. PL03 TaxID=3088353 RepID=UPI0029CD351B|nr:endonuclease/exonuclease/phosphatase family protein [Polaribacter sp. PL03]MDX6747093.1 endonuclease/exonuclease/phosphatase family protein [Polaribacter sp. PL03]